MHKKYDRVRIYSHELGNLYGTVVQDHSLTGGPIVLVHIDGLRSTDPRWIHKDLLWAEVYTGQYARDRVGE